MTDLVHPSRRLEVYSLERGKKYRDTPGWVACHKWGIKWWHATKWKMLRSLVFFPTWLAKHCSQGITSRPEISKMIRLVEKTPNVYKSINILGFSTHARHPTLKWLYVKLLSPEFLRIHSQLCPLTSLEWDSYKLHRQAETRLLLFSFSFPKILHVTVVMLSFLYRARFLSAVQISKLDNMLSRDTHIGEFIKHSLMIWLD